MIGWYGMAWFGLTRERCGELEVRSGKETGAVGPVVANST